MPLDTAVSAFHALPESMRTTRRWLVWKSKPHADPTKKAKKMPYYVGGTPRNGKLDTPADRANLATFEAACAALRTGRYAGIGFALGDDGNGNHWQGIDLDGTDTRAELAALVDRLPGYVERSPSGNGWHAIGIGRDVATLGSNESGIEAYSHGRYFTVTGDDGRGDVECIASFIETVLNPMHSGKPAAPRLNKSSTTRGGAKSGFFAKVNAKAMASLNSWVPEIFPKAKPYHDGFRVSSADLGRDMEEDLSIVPAGARDFGEESGKTPIDLVIEWGPASDASSAALLLCDLMSVDPAALGWSKKNRPPTHRAAHDGKTNDVHNVHNVHSEGDGEGEEDDVDPPAARLFDKHDPRLMRKSGKSELLKNLLNAVCIAENALPGLIGYNEFRQRVELRIHAPWRQDIGAWTEIDTCELAVYLTPRFAGFNLDMLRSAIDTVAHRHRFNPAQDKLRALAEHWDGVARLDTWLIDHLNAAYNSSNEEYLREIGAAWLKGVVARVLFPGCKRDDVLVLRGPQGWRKSTAAQSIADAIHPDSFTDNLGDLSSKDSRSGIRGMIIAELGELAALNKSDIESIKQFVAAKSDHFREAYGRGDRDYPRTVSFIGTTNDPTFLKDPTGNRRWWPVTIGAPINIARLDAALPQIIGEAARRVLAGEAWYVSNDAALAQAEAVRAAHFAEDVWTEPVLQSAALLMSGGKCPRCHGSGRKETAYPGRDGIPGQCFLCHGTGVLDGAHPEYVTVSGIMNAMGIRLEQQTVPNSMRVGAILRVSGWTDKRKRIGKRSDSLKAIVWHPPKVVPPLLRVVPKGGTKKTQQNHSGQLVPPGTTLLDTFQEKKEVEDTIATGPETENGSIVDADFTEVMKTGCPGWYRVVPEGNASDIKEFFGTTLPEIEGGTSKQGGTTLSPADTTAAPVREVPASMPAKAAPLHTCGNCRHGKRAPDSSAESWRTCAEGPRGGWAHAETGCEVWATAEPAGR